MIANAMLHLLSSPAELETALADRWLIPAAVEESLRLEPAAAVVDRYATRDTRLGQARILAGDQVTVSIAGRTGTRPSAIPTFSTSAAPTRAGSWPSPMARISALVSTWPAWRRG